MEQLAEQGLWEHRYQSKLRSGPLVSDFLVSSQALRQGIVAHAISAHGVGNGMPSWNGLVLGYAQVPVSQIDETVKKMVVITQKARK